MTPPINKWIEFLVLVTAMNVAAFWVGFDILNVFANI